MRIAQRLQRIAPSATLTITARAARLEAAGIDVVSFGVGEPDFDTPRPVIEAAKRALDAGVTRYTPAAGFLELRAAIAASYGKRHRVPVETDNVMVTVGAKHGLYNAAMALVEPGDKVLVPSPCWVSYPAQARLAGGQPVFVQTREEDGFRVDPGAFEEALDEHEPAYVLLNSPGNPTGMCYGRAQLEELLEALRRHPKTALVWDSIYERLVYDGFEHVEPTTLAPDLLDRIVVVSGFSKAFAMTGWRLGYTIGPKPVIDAMSKLQGHVTSNPTAFAQAAAMAALQLPDSVIDDMVRAFDRRRRRMVELLRSIDGVRCLAPTGAFYAFPNFSAWIGARAGDRVITDDTELVEYLLEEARVLVVPGSAFGAPGYLRLSYALSYETMEEGLQRLVAAMARLVRTA